jgi:hypothetical protein
MSCSLTQGFLLDCQNGFGGVKEVYVMEFANATTITVTAGVVTIITKATGKQFWKYNLVASTGEADETLTRNRENGTQMSKQSVKFPINKMTTAVRNELLLLAQNFLLIVVVDRNGTGWLYGYDNGMMLESAAAKTGKALTDRNGYELAFTSDEKDLAVSLDVTTLGTLTTPGV